MLSGESCFAPQRKNLDLASGEKIVPTWSGCVDQERFFKRYYAVNETGCEDETTTHAKSGYLPTDDHVEFTY